MTAIRIRFPQGIFPELRHRLLADPGREAFALLFGQYHQVGDQTLIKVVAVRHPGPEDYEGQGLAHLRLRREYVYDCLVEMQQRGDVDTMIDVHTHPFCAQGAAFSSVDDYDEIAFHRWLNGTLDDMHYGSIVLSQSDYAARLWEREAGRTVAHRAEVKTQMVAEGCPAAGAAPLPEVLLAALDPQQGFLARSVLALGLDTLRLMMHGQRIAIVGVGGLGSIIAENLIHTGFHALDLIDPDRVEMTNLNRIVGAYHQDALDKRLKVEVVRDHLMRINPQAQVAAYPCGVEDEGVLPALAGADWILLATDSQYSRFKAQEIALRFAVPLISSGVNISVEGGRITDMSGEVIVARCGDGLCLNCLGRINPTLVAAEQHQTDYIGQELVRRGYVEGENVKDPAVKTLNATLAALAVDMLVNQFTERLPHIPILIFESNAQYALYQDHESVSDRPKGCFHCA